MGNYFWLALLIVGFVVFGALTFDGLAFDPQEHADQYHGGDLEEGLKSKEVVDVLTALFGVAMVLCGVGIVFGGQAAKIEMRGLAQ